MQCAQRVFISLRDCLWYFPVELVDTSGRFSAIFEKVDFHGITADSKWEPPSLTTLLDTAYGQGSNF